MRGDPLGVIEKAGAYFSGGIVDVGVKNAGEASHLRRNMRRVEGGGGGLGAEGVGETLGGTVL